MSPAATRPAGSLGDAFAGARVVVTGGAGFIGSHLVDALLGFGATVTVLDDLSSGDADRLFARVDDAPDQLRVVHGSVLDRDALDDAVERAGLVFHLAAMSSAVESVREPERCFAVNAQGTVETLQAARAARVGRVVLASTAAVYGLSPATPTREDAPLDPITPYGASKAAAEAATRAWPAAFDDVDAVSLRLFNVYGPRQRVGAGDEGAVVATFLDVLSRGERPTIFGDGEQTRDFVYVTDVVRAFLLAGARERAFGGQSINIGSGRTASVNRLLAQCGATLGRQAVAAFAPPRVGDPRSSCADASRARRELGFEAATSLEVGLAETAARSGGREPRDESDEPDDAGRPASGAGAGPTAAGPGDATPEVCVRSARCEVERD